MKPTPGQPFSWGESSSGPDSEPHPWGHKPLDPTLEGGGDDTSSVFTTPMRVAPAEDKHDADNSKMDSVVEIDDDEGDGDDNWSDEDEDVLSVGDDVSSVPTMKEPASVVDNRKLLSIGSVLVAVEASTSDAIRDNRQSPSQIVDCELLSAGNGLATVEALTEALTLDVTSDDINDNRPFPGIVEQDPLLPFQSSLSIGKNLATVEASTDALTSDVISDNRPFSSLGMIKQDQFVGLLKEPPHQAPLPSDVNYVSEGFVELDKFEGLPPKPPHQAPLPSDLNYISEDEQDGDSDWESDPDQEPTSEHYTNSVPQAQTSYGSRHIVQGEHTMKHDSSETAAVTVSMSNDVLSTAYKPADLLEQTAETPLDLDVMSEVRPGDDDGHIGDITSSMIPELHIGDDSVTDTFLPPFYLPSLSAYPLFSNPDTD